MATMKQIKEQIKSVSNIKKMTKALEIVSTAKLQKIRTKTQSYRDFINEFFRIAQVVHEKVDLFADMHITANSNKTLLIVLSTDRGLCGPLNSKLFKTIFSHYVDKKDERKDVDVFCIGKKSLEFFVRTGFSTVGTLQVSDDIKENDLVTLNQYLMEAIASKEYVNIKVCFNYFQSPLKQVPVMLDLLPFDKNSLDAFADQIGLDVSLDTYLNDSSSHDDLTLEPSTEVVRNEFMGQLMQHLVYGAVLQNKAGEFSSRMIAMKNAKDNAHSMIEDLTLQFNKARQAAITQEISEIVSAKMAMES